MAGTLLAFMLFFVPTYAIMYVPKDKCSYLKLGLEVPRTMELGLMVADTPVVGGMAFSQYITNLTSMITISLV